MQFYLFHAVTQTWGGGPSAENINAAFHAATITDQDPALVGRWVGTRARITRTGGLEASVSLTPSNTTHAARLYELGDGRPPEAVAAVLAMVRDNLVTALASDAPGGSEGWLVEDPAVLAPAVNGAASWWDSDQAAITQTENGPNVLNNATAEFPTGPTTARNSVQPQQGPSSFVIPWWAYALVVSVVVVQLAPAINATVQTLAVRRQLGAVRKVVPSTPTGPATRTNGQRRR